MAVTDNIIGRYVELRSATVDDAEFTLELRQNPDLTKYLPRLDISVEQQKQWIRSQREKPGDYFFVARNNDHKPIGTVSIYNVQTDTADSGRLALIGNAMENTESVLLLLRYAFDTLHLKKVTGYILDGNKRAERFNNQFGCNFSERRTSDDGSLIRDTVIDCNDFYLAEKKLCGILYKEQ